VINLIRCQSVCANDTSSLPGCVSDMSSLATPTSADEDGAPRARKRRQTHGLDTTSSPRYAGVADEETIFTRYFDPNQDAEERRTIKQKSRALERNFNGRWRVSS
jgi:hypothetical protein